MPLDLVTKRRTPLATTSANLSGQPPAITAAQVCVTLSGRISLVIDGGPATLGKPSTVLDVTTPSPQVLRQGAAEKQVNQAITGS